MIYIYIYIYWHNGLAYEMHHVESAINISSSWRVGDILDSWGTVSIRTQNCYAIQQIDDSSTLIFCIRDLQ